MFSSVLAKRLSCHHIKSSESRMDNWHSTSDILERGLNIIWNWVRSGNCGVYGSIVVWLSAKSVNPLPTRANMNRENPANKKHSSLLFCKTSDKTSLMPKLILIAFNYQQCGLYLIIYFWQSIWSDRTLVFTKWPRTWSLDQTAIRK